MSAATDLRLRQKLPPVGIAAGAEDAKYQAKYKELKRKVKDIEAVCSVHSHDALCSHPSSRTMTNFIFRSSRQSSPSAE
jgi:hypothetical protein